MPQESQPNWQPIRPKGSEAVTRGRIATFGPKYTAGITLVPSWFY
jgi:hypothetical protein